MKIVYLVQLKCYYMRECERIALKTVRPANSANLSAKAIHIALWTACEIKSFYGLDALTTISFSY